MALPDAGVSAFGGVLTMTVPVDQVAGMNTPLDVSLNAVNTSARTLETPTMAQ